MPTEGSARRRADRFLLSSIGKQQGVIFLDIETTGLSRHYDEITIVGYLLNGEFGVYIRGDDPAPMIAALATADTIVTFNGTLFDIPFLQKEFAGARVPNKHIDLRYAARRIGLEGGQKALERQLGIDVRMGVAHVDGAEAVLLWHRYLRGDFDALRSLIHYNVADIRGMCAILDHVVDRVEHRDLLIEPPRFGALKTVFTGCAHPDFPLPNPARLGRIVPTFQDVFGRRGAANAVIVGVDLTGSETKPSGFCVLRGAVAETAMIASDASILEAIVAARPALVSIDSPLCLPRGRIHVNDDDPGRAQYGIMRVCERTLKRRGINVYPCLLPSMQRLTERGIKLAGTLRRLGFPVIESYPGAAQDIMGIPRKGAGVQWLRQGLADFGITGAFLSASVTHDELDAITSALVGTFLLDGKFEALGGEGESALIVPHLAAVSGPTVIGISGRIAAGKTTAARMIEAMGFAYTRFSLVIDEEIAARGLEPNRVTRQSIGMEIHETRGQAWLSEQTIDRVGDARYIVVDGLRWPEDHAFFVEKYGNKFLHVHLTAPADLRWRRTGHDDDARQAFEIADLQPVEAMIDVLGGLASEVVENVSSLEHLESEVTRIVHTLSLEAS